MAHIYLAKEGAEDKTLPIEYIKHDWRLRPSIEDLENYKVRKGRVSVIDLLRRVLPVQHLFASENETTFHVYSHDGHAIIKKRGENEYSYDIVEGKDPLGYDTLVKEGKIAYREWLNDREWLAATCEAEFPDVPVQISQIFDSERSGDLIINSRMGWDLMPESPPHRGSHGGLHAAEMRVPLLVANSSYEVKPDQPLRTLDVLDILLA